MQDNVFTVTGGERHSSSHRIWASCATKALHPSTSNRLLGMSERIHRVRFRCLQEPQMINSLCRRLTHYFLVQVGLAFVQFWCPTT